MDTSLASNSLNQVAFITSFLRSPLMGFFEGFEAHHFVYVTRVFFSALRKSKGSDSWAV